MAPSVLGMGIPHTSPLVPEESRENLKKMIEAMDAEMKASRFDWDLFFVEPEMQFDDLVQKLREKNWDLIMIGGGVRNGSVLTPFFEKIVNTVHKELPNTKFAFNTSLDKTLEACNRAWEL